MSSYGMYGIRCLVVLTELFLLTVGARAQYETQLQTGLLPFQSYDANEIDSVNLQNGNVSLRIPLVDYPQVGGVLKLSYSASYDSKAAYAARICPPPPGGACDYVWGSPGSVISCCNLHGSLNPTPIAIVPTGLGGGVKGTNYKDVNGQSVTTYSACEDGGSSCHPVVSADGTYRSTDATGISANPTTGEVVDKQGVHHFKIAYPNSGVTARDPYGNTISYSSTTGVVTDTMGRPFSAATSSDTSGCLATGTPGVNIWSFPGPNGGTLSFKVCTVMSSYSKQIPPSSSAATTSIYSATSQSILLPDGRSWILQYAGPAGELTSVTLPTGGTISYPYASQPNSSNSIGNWSSYVRTRTVSDGTHSYKWNYTYDVSGQTAHSTTVTTPNGDDIVHTFQCLASYQLEPCDGFYETSVTYYKGSHSANPPVILRTVATTYNYSGVNFCVYQTPCVIETINVTPASKTVTLDDGSASTTSYSYDSSFTIPLQVVGSGGSYGDLTQQIDYDYTGLLLRKTINTYLFAANSSYKTLNMLDRVQSTTIYDGSSQQAAKTTYVYDEGSTLTGSNTSCSAG